MDKRESKIHNRIIIEGNGGDKPTGDNHRHHAQTIGCKSCEFFLFYYGEGGEKREEQALNQAINALRSGKLIAIKGVGGYHLACMPSNSEAVKALRIIKGRDEKPFAVMFPDISQIEEVCDVTASEKKLLISSTRPIVILPKKKDIFSYDVTGASNSCGCFLPYTLLQEMILKETGALIMTSANKSKCPIIIEDYEMRKYFENSNQPVFAGVLCHDRDILRRLDDSVARVAAEQTQLLRRSRGYDLQPIQIVANKNNKRLSVVGAGGDLKSSFCIISGGCAYMSQHIGDLENDSTIKHFKTAYDDLKTLLGANPTIVAYDKHPLYHSSALAAESGLDLVQVQHHHAHIASVIAENRLTGDVLGVSFDGTGYGDDETIWGGEFLVCTGTSYRRAGHLKCFKQLGGDSSAVDARKIADCILYSEGLEEHIQEGPDKKLLMAALLHNVNTVESSSMGRLFDAVSSILGICHYNSYEGKCAILLEQAAASAVRKGKKSLPMSLDSIWENGMLVFSPKRALLELLSAEDVEAAALGFHEAVAEMVVTGCTEIAKRDNLTQIALSGGVFQNKLLFEQSVKMLEEQGFKVFWNRLVPPNDGGIALGQAYIALLKEEEQNHVCCSTW